MTETKDQNTSTIDVLNFIATIIFYAMIINAAILIWDLFDQDAVVSGFPVQYSISNFGEIDSWTGSYLSVRLDKADGVWEIKSPPLYMKVVLIILELIRLGMFIFIVFLLKKIIDSFKGTGPFVYENVKRLKQMAITFISIDLYYYLLSIIAFFWLHPNPIIDEISIFRSIGLNLKYFFIGLLIYAIAEIFKAGANLKKEQELTI